MLDTLYVGGVEEGGLDAIQSRRCIAVFVFSDMNESVAGVFPRQLEILLFFSVPDYRSCRNDIPEDVERSFEENDNLIAFATAHVKTETVPILGLKQSDIPAVLHSQSEEEACFGRSMDMKKIRPSLSVERSPQ